MHFIISETEVFAESFDKSKRVTQEECIETDSVFVIGPGSVVYRFETFAVQETESYELRHAEVVEHNSENVGHLGVDFFNHFLV